MCIIRVGDFLEGLFSFFTLGHSKYLAMFIANKLGYADCGCDERRDKLNKFFGCPQKDIKLD